eukprot:400243_1
MSELTKNSSASSSLSIAMSQSVSTFSQRMGRSESYNSNRLLSAQRSLRSVLINQIHSMSNHCDEITDLYLNQTYVYLVKLVAVIQSKHSNTDDMFTQYVVSDRTGQITCKIWESDHRFEANDKIYLIGKIFTENHETKINIHHMELLSDNHGDEMQLHELEVQYDELLCDVKHTQPRIYQQYLNDLMTEKIELERAYYNELDGQNETNYSFHDAPPSFIHGRRSQNSRFNTQIIAQLPPIPVDNESIRSRAVQMRNQRQRANSFAPNANNNNNNYNVMRATPKHNRRQSAPYTNENSNSNPAQCVSEDVQRSNIICGVIDTLFSLKKQDVSIYDIVQKTRFQASKSQMYQYLRILEDDGRIFSTHDQNHWRPVS